MRVELPGLAAVQVESFLRHERDVLCCRQGAQPLALHFFGRDVVSQFTQALSPEISECQPGCEQFCYVTGAAKIPNNRDPESLATRFFFRKKNPRGNLSIDATIVGCNQLGQLGCVVV